MALFVVYGCGQWLHSGYLVFFYDYGYMGSVLWVEFPVPVPVRCGTVVAGLSGTGGTL